MDSDGLPPTDTKDEIGKQLPPSIETADSVTQLRKVVDSALDAVIMTDESSMITDWSAQAEKLFGWSRRATCDDSASGRRAANNAWVTRSSSLHCQSRDSPDSHN